MEHTEKKNNAGRIALAVAAVVVLAAGLIAVIVTGLGTAVDSTQTDTAQVEIVETAGTVPADGNPQDETAKGSYTAADATVIAAADTVVATAGDKTLTNGQLQVYYWMEVQNFLSNYGSYASYFGLDYTQPLDTQVCGVSETGCTWQQFFLASALNSWRNYQAMAAEAEKADYQLEESVRDQLDTLEEALTQNAQLYGFDSAEAFLAQNLGAGASMADYAHFMELYYPGVMYYNALCEANAPTDAEVEAYFTENEQAYLESGLSREDKYVDVRHILIMPEGATSENIRTETFPEEAWQASREKAEALLKQWEESDKTEDTFAAMAMAHSQDGSASEGGLYTDVAKGQMVENFESWCFDDSRKTGDSGLVETEFGYHVMYFVSSRPVWPDYAKSELSNERANQLLSDILEQYPMEADFSKMVLGYVSLTGETRTDTVAEETKEHLFSEENRPALIIAAVSAAMLAGVYYLLDKKERG